MHLSGTQSFTRDTGEQRKTHSLCGAPPVTLPLQAVGGVAISAGEPAPAVRERAARPVVGKGRAHGSFGELLQGLLPDGADEHFLISLPITRYSYAEFTPGGPGTPLAVAPVHKNKSHTMARLVLDHFGADFGGSLVIESDLPEGKGLASSTADLVATARALQHSLGRELPMDRLLAFLHEIEPSDGVMYPDYVVFDHRRVRLRARLGALPKMRVLAVAEDYEIDTIAYNNQPLVFEEAARREYASLLATAIGAFLDGDLATIGAVATRSAVLNQKRNPKRWLDRVLAIAEAVGALGVVVAHSGPSLGLLFPGDAPVDAARATLAELSPEVWLLETLGGDDPVAMRRVP